MLTSRDNVRRAISFQGPEWLPHDFPADFGTDFAGVGMNPSPDLRPVGGRGVDEWGAVWENISTSQVGEVKEFPLKSWDDFLTFQIPDIRDPNRWVNMADARANAGDKFLFGYGISLYERVHFLRGLENTWLDIYEEPERLGELLDILVEMNVYAIEQFAAAGVDALIFPDDWGLQNRLMISPEKWREIWKPRYHRVYQTAHNAGLHTFLHSCGHIVDILDDLIEIGLDVIHMDQQENMGLELLGERFGGRLTFYSPVDIQTAMHRSDDDIRSYARQMVKLLGRPEGGIMPRWYTDPKAAGHTEHALKIMCEEFFTISKEMYGATGAE